MKNENKDNKERMISQRKKEWYLKWKKIDSLLCNFFLCIRQSFLDWPCSAQFILFLFCCDLFSKVYVIKIVENNSFTQCTLCEKEALLGKMERTKQTTAAWKSIDRKAPRKEYATKSLFGKTTPGYWILRKPHLCLSSRCY